MKFLAIEKEVLNADWNDTQKILQQEAEHVYDLYSKGIVREIYFTEKHEAVLILEGNSSDEIRQTLAEFPLVRQQLIQFELKELSPYTGFERLFSSQSERATK
jgi:muconolactone delta-isomerase